MKTKHNYVAAIMITLLFFASGGYVMLAEGNDMQLAPAAQENPEQQQSDKWNGKRNHWQESANPEDVETFKASRASYKETMSNWKQSRTISNPGEQNVTLEQKSPESKATASSHLDKANTDRVIEGSKSSVSELLEAGEIGLAYDYATELLRENPHDEEVKKQFAAVYKLYSDYVVKRQAEIMHGGSK